ncbi:MAG: hypothetical protein WAT39_12690 [Planctomycetota bacterium]
MRNLSTLVSAIALTSVSALCQTVLVPSSVLGPFAGTSGNYFTAAGINRFQMIYDTTHFTSQGVIQPISITHVEFLFGAATPLTVVTYPSVSVYLQPSAVDWAVQSTTFASNRSIAFPVTPEYSGPVTTQAGTYYVSIPLTTPFSYDPTAGVDLLLEVEVNGAPTPATGNSQATTYSATPPANLCNVKRSVGSITAVNGLNSAFVPIVNFNYVPAPNAGVATPVGAGCYAKYASIYELFASPANFDLQSSTLSFVSLGVGQGYAVIRNTGAWLPIGSIQAVPTVLALGDDTDINYPFTTGSFPGWTGLQVCSNAYVAAAAGNSLVAAPSINQMLVANPQPAFYCQLDLDPQAPGLGAGTIQVEESASVTTVTYNGVTNWNSGTGAAPCDIQFQFYPNGDVTIAWGANFTTFQPNGGVIVGYSPGGPNINPGNRDISALPLGVVLQGADTNPLTLASLTRPVINTNWNLEAQSIPDLSPGTPAQIGIEIYGIGDPGIPDLFFLGAPGCGLRVTLDVLNPFVQFAPATTHAFTVPVPNNPSLVGAIFNVGTAVLDSSYNAFGVITSNAISGLIGSI